MGVNSDGRVYILTVVHVFACSVCVRTIGDVCVWTSVGQDYIGAGRVYTFTGALVSPIIGGLMCRDDVTRVRMICVFVSDEFCNRAVVVAHVIWVSSIVVVFDGC